MTLPSLSSVMADDSSSSLSADAPGVSTLSFSLNALLHGDLSDPDTNIRRPVCDVTVSDDFLSTLPPSTEDPRHPDVAFAHSLVNSYLRAPVPDSRNGGGMQQDKSNTSSPNDFKSVLHYLRELNDRKITYQETLEAMASGRCDADLHAAETANIENHSIMAVGADAKAQASQERKHLSQLLAAANDLDKQLGTHETYGADFHCDYSRLSELSAPPVPVPVQDRPTDNPTAVAFNLVMSLFKKSWAAMDSGAMKHLFDDSIHLENERPPLPEENMMSASGHVIRPSKVGDYQLEARDPTTGESL